MNSQNQSSRGSGRSSRSLLNAIVGFLVLGSLAMVFVRNFGRKPSESVEDPTNRKMIRNLVDSEELILSLTPQLKGLSTSALNLNVPDHNSDALFHDDWTCLGLAPIDQQREVANSSLVSIANYDWPVASQSTKSTSTELKVWPELFAEIEFFEHCKFYLIDGHFDDASPGLFVTHMGFSGLAKTLNGNWRAISAKQTVVWRSNDEAPKVGSDWRIVDWQTKYLNFQEGPQLLFEETLDLALPDREQYYKARNGLHNEYVIQAVSTGRIKLPVEKYRRYFYVTAAGQHPALSVVDVDNDGWDDLYVMIRWGNNQLLHNQGDGTFVENARKFGLDVGGVSAGGIFADFDNDGDSDLMLGRSLERTVLLMNEDGHFKDRTEELVSEPLPYLVTSVSAADYNGDGLLDVYLSTYGMPADRKQGAERWSADFLNKEQAVEVLRRFDDPVIGYNRFLNAIGPPNVLLVNRGGGKFEVSPENEKLQLWLNSLQATWCDYDNDGDPDLYVANDFAPDALFRNDDGVFVEIAQQAGGPTMTGFGMGASWGDYDNDGRQDLYVSNMYSKAGMRITEQIPGLDERFRRSADGNRLYRNICDASIGDKFELVSNNQQEGLQVANAGWSWGGQFLDIDNDTELDIYVTSGYRTAPKEVATEIDL